MRLRVLLLIAALLPLLCAELSRTKDLSSVSGSGKVKPTACGKDCENNARARKKSTPGIKGHASKKDKPGPEHSTPKKSSPWTTQHTPPKRSMPGTEDRTTKRSAPTSKDGTRKMSTPGTEHGTPKKSTARTEHRTTKRNTPSRKDETRKMGTARTGASTPKKSTFWPKCELYYFVPTAENTDEAFFFWNNSRAEQLKVYDKIVPFLSAKSRINIPIFFPAHLPLVEKRNGSEVLVLKDVYVRANGTCGKAPEKTNFDTNPGWYQDPGQRLQVKLRMLEDYVQKIPRSHWGYRVPKDGEDDVCLDESGLVVKDFPGIRTCFSMWIDDTWDQKPKHFAGRQIYNRINQTLTVNVSRIGFDRTGGSSLVEPISPEEFSLPALFLKEMCHVTNASLNNSCTYWATNRFYVSLCCCYTNRTECAYRNYKFPSQKKKGDPVILACATGDYFLLKPFGGEHEPNNTSYISISVKQFVQERTSSEFCQWTYTWNASNGTDVEDVLQVDLAAVKGATPDELKNMRDCAKEAIDGSCCERTKTLCPLDLGQENIDIGVQCFCNDGDLCNNRHSYLDKDLVRKFKEAPPCEDHTVAEHLLSQNDEHKKPNTSRTTGFMCPVFHNFALPGRENAFLHLVGANNFLFVDTTDRWLFQEDGCHLVEVTIFEEAYCSDKLFGEHEQALEEKILILLCAVEGNPVGEPRKSYPDAELKKTIEANLTAAKEAFAKCKYGSLSLDFESLSELVMDHHKLARLVDNLTEGTNDNISTPHCYVEASFLYQHQYNFTFGEVSIDNKTLHDTCHVSADNVSDSGIDATKCVKLDSAADDERQHHTCCCRRHWNLTRSRCREALLDELKILLWKSTIAEEPKDIMDKLKKDPLTKCADKADTTADLNRPCGRNEGCYTGVHARDVPTTRTHKEYGGCVSEYAADAKKRDDATSSEADARFYRICRISRNQGHCFAVVGTEDTELPDDVKGPQMVCCCEGRIETPQKCGTSRKFGMKIGDFNID